MLSIYNMLSVIKKIDEIINISLSFVLTVIDSTSLSSKDYVSIYFFCNIMIIFK